MQDTAIPTNMYGKLYATRRRGRPKTRWLDDVSTDLRKMGIENTLECFISFYLFNPLAYTAACEAV
jgi:hypothetical protein